MHADDSDLIQASAHSLLKQDLAETRNRLWFPGPGQALKPRRYQHKINEQAGAKRDEQKNAEATKCAISRHDRTKLPENRRAHKMFSRTRR